MASEFKIPELGENIESGDVAKILVSVGDFLEIDQPVLELETDKAVVEIPSSIRGKVKEIHIKAGDQVSIGQSILTVEDNIEESKADPEPTSASTDTSPKETQETTPHQSIKQEQLLSIPEPIVSPTKPESSSAVKQETAASSDIIPVPATPSVRRLARELGVDIHQVFGSGSGGRISAEDIKQYVHDQLSDQIQSSSISPIVLSPLPQFERWGSIRRESISKIRSKTAEHMTHAWTAPHVTQHDYADITQFEQERKRLAERVEKSGGKLTLTAIALKIVASALKMFPHFNTSLDLVTKELIYKEYYHIGVAVDTEHGLLVPVIRDVNLKNITEIAIELTILAEKAKNRKLAPEEMEGSTFTITNLGGLGGSHFTPIINWPAVAILGISRAKMMPVYIDGEFQPRLLMPLSLSYDHRVIDGADAVRFLRWIIDLLEEPMLLSLSG
ncbi:2-oxo acid dehydrogenase subunit E2 [Candidatus Nitrosacidococcus tergens]|uniref:Dihydrolipoamide acetyltransferase component of pyruvate dehydrogenase complex n=1 Tax=Candidatus Nitrosacidococcus tergens TaxID=553981 RepID=A0A7G1Q8Q5_9GAMM|nr:2-oxo acid dehydrogenase subunit E2 [Candidatus Nitrosacidococcus tergens]CAB1275193.1 Pyruvate dehydrogenase, dihydrolipoyltransacetylase component E2 [Candidatus Nitrosacidococcus tergens]